MISNLAPFVGHPEPAQLSNEKVQRRLLLVGPEGTKIKGLLRLRTEGQN